jgi:hypothetical protein
LSPVKMTKKAQLFSFPLLKLVDHLQECAWNATS